MTTTHAVLRYTLPSGDRDISVELTVKPDDLSFIRDIDAELRALGYAHALAKEPHKPEGNPERASTQAEDQDGTDWFDVVRTILSADKGYLGFNVNKLNNAIDAINTVRAEIDGPADCAANVTNEPAHPDIIPGLSLEEAEGALKLFEKISAITGCGAPSKMNADRLRRHIAALKARNIAGENK